MGGYIIHLLSDNTTESSWISYAAQTPDPLLQGLARLGAVLVVAVCCLLTKVVPYHIAEIKNTEADVLS